MHHRGCALTCSTLVPLCSTSLEPPDSLMAQKGRFWPFWTLFGHISGQNGWNKSVAHWNKSILTKTKQKTSLVVMENRLRNPPPSLTHCVAWMSSQSCVLSFLIIVFLRKFIFNCSSLFVLVHRNLPGSLLCPVYCLFLFLSFCRFAFLSFCLFVFLP